MTLIPDCTLAQYTVRPSVIAGGGARAMGGAYVVTGTTCQSSPVNISTGGAYRTEHGFWHAASSGSDPLSPMVLTLTLLSPSTARLSWVLVAGATAYDIYRSTTPYFNAGGAAWQTVAAPETDLDVMNGVGDPTVNFYYRGVARNSSQTSPQSNTVGEFDFGGGWSLLRPTSAAETDD